MSVGVTCGSNIAAKVEGNVYKLVVTLAMMYGLDIMA